MKVHHLNCATLRPTGGFLMSGSIFKKADMICHCLLIETNDGLVLVDTGLGKKTLQYAYGELGPAFLLTSNPILKKEETAIYQIKKLGFQSEDVKHIVLTHLDIDHAGGLSDFPHAMVHIFDEEFKIATAKNKNFNESQRYNPFQWTHGPNWKIHTNKKNTDTWKDFAIVDQAHGLPPEVLLIPLTGHTKGHCGVAVKTDSGWLLHAGDTYFNRIQIEQKKPKCPIMLELHQKFFCDDNKTRMENLNKLRLLANDTKENVKVFCSHDKDEFNNFVK